MGKCLWPHRGRTNMGNAAVDNARNLRRVSMTPLGSTESDEQRKAAGSGCAVPWAASKPLNDEQQTQLKGNRSAHINPNIDGRTRPARQEALVVFIQTGNHQGA